MATPLQKSMGRAYGAGMTGETGGRYPIWLDQRGSRIMGGLIDLSATYKTGLTIANVYPTGIRTGTMGAISGDKVITPIATFKVIGAVSSTATKLTLANWDGCAKLVDGMVLNTFDATAKSLTIDMDSVTIDSDGNYEITITANAVGTRADGDALILSECTSMIPQGLTKDNLEYEGLAAATTKLNIVLIDTGRILNAPIAAVPDDYKYKYLQTIKFED